MTLKADLHTTWRGKNNTTASIQGEKNLCSQSEDAFRLMKDVEQQEDWQAITMIGVLCEVRDRDCGEEECPHLFPPMSTGARCLLACMLLQAWLKQSMHSTLFISK